MGIQESQLLFSNAVLDGFLNYAHDYSFRNKTLHYQELIRELGVSEESLKDKSAWRDPEFIDRFFKIYQYVFSDSPRVVFDGSKYLFTQSKLHRFSSLAGLLVRPELVFGKLKTGAARMNLYNTFEFQLMEKSVSQSRGMLRVGYRNPQAKELNECLCEASHGSVAGILEFLGYPCAEVNESVCVRKGHDHCEIEITWMNRVSWRDFADPIAVGCVAAAATYGLLSESPLAVALVGLGAGMIYNARAMIKRNERFLRSAYEFQQRTLVDLRESFLKQEMLSKNLIDWQTSSAETLRLARLGEITHSYVHDLAGPISVVQAASDWMVKNVLKEGIYDPERMAKYTEKIGRSVKSIERMNALWRKLSTVDSGDRKIVSVDARLAVGETLSLFDIFFEKNAIEASFHADTDVLSQCQLPESTLEQVLLNLVQNAIAALEKVSNRKRTLEVALSSDSSRSDSLLLVIRDSGYGIPEDRREKLFKMFGASSTTGGTGFGMYAVQKAVVGMNGTIELQSTSAGTTWMIRFPRASRAPLAEKDRDSSSDIAKVVA